MGILAGMRTHAWPARSAPAETVGVVMVSFNTRMITAQAIYSLVTTVAWPGFRLVVVDNASTDGSAPLLRALADAGLCEVILNDVQRYHGPALNQAMDHLASAATNGDHVGYVWILDSDCIIVRGDALAAAARVMTATGAGLAGQWLHDEWHAGDMMGLHCVLIDPAQVWRDPIAPFEEHGSPSRHLQQSAIAAGIVTAELPFTRDGYVVHLGRSTLRGVAERGDRANRYFDWATTHQEPHFMGETEAPRRYRAFLDRFAADVGELTPGNLVAACLRRSSAST
jgi:glycosyltransferase involved in cell wall biosynthesis